MPAVVASAPGRVNLIGEHTDYNGGLCLPLALSQRTTVSLTPRDDLLLGLRSAQQEDAWEGSVEDLPEGWPAYVAGVVGALREEGYAVPGFDAIIDSDVPLGAGLSSSAALECATAVAVAGLVGLDLDDATRRRLAGVCRRAENDYVGAPTGGMDQMVAMLARPDHALLLDFADDSVTPVLLPLDEAGLLLLVIDTRVS
ncbi:MAG: galactokinase, partial [Nocardioidaceae bacterium]|nr:galactokinase [Nocardioidaceae bacterium]